MSDFSYVGSELELFAEAVNWKAYLGRHLGGYVQGRVLEVGAGIGGTTPFLCGGRQESWTCLEPDAGLAGHLSARARAGALGVEPEIVVGFVSDLAKGRTFDSILYVDVLEHVQDDRRELRLAAERLSANGHLIVLSPGSPCLFGAFDETIGHHRRYSRASLRAIGPQGTQLCRVFCLDSLGWVLALVGRAIVRGGAPSRGQILMWDRLFIPMSKLTDPATGWRVGRSIAAIWRKEPA